jgi:hypothetical protein
MRRQEYISPRLYDVCRMTQRAPVMAILILVVASTTASAQTAGTSGPAPDRNPFLYLFHNIVLDAKRLPSVETAVTLGAGGALALAVHPADDTVTERATAGGPRDFYQVGSTIGDGWAQIGFAVGTYTTGLLAHKPSVTHFGADLVRAQTINAVVTQGLKFAIRRERPGNPGGKSYSMPSGHTSSAFTTSAIVWRHFGWKAGLPASAVSAWVGAGRVQLGKHFVSDVVFGAAVGTMAGRTVTIGHGRKVVSVAPAAVPGGAAIAFTLIER